MGRWGAICGQEALVMGHSGVGWAVPGRVAELEPSAGLWLTCTSILLDIASSRLLGGWVGLSLSLNLSSGSQAPAAPSIFTMSPRGGHTAYPRDGHNRGFPWHRWTNRLLILGSEQLTRDRWVCIMGLPTGPLEQSLESTTGVSPECLVGNDIGPRWLMSSI